jgi:GNAT superfamily N-acetyltransferase
MVPRQWMGLMSAGETHRLLTLEDIAAATELSLLAGWNQTAEDWRILIELDPAGCFACEVDGKVAATTTLLSYEKRLAWIGMVLTRPEYRRRGLARRLMAQALERVRSLQIATVKLDATDLGQPLYESLGFRTEQVVERWARPGLAESQSVKANADVSERTKKLDSDAFGVDRSRLLHHLAKRNPPLVNEQGYLFYRGGRVSSYLGPCVARDPASALELVDLCVRTRAASNWFWDLLPESRDAVAIARELGFTPQRRLLRMVQGAGLKGHEEMIYAIAGFEFG